jgi:hypothetical protein
MSISPAEILGSAGRDPRALHALLMAGQQDRTLTLARAFEEAGEAAQAGYTRGRQAHGEIAQAYTTNAAPVLDAAAADTQAWRLLGRGGRDMEDTAGFLKRSVLALDDAQRSSTAALSRMEGELSALVRSWSAHLQANLGQFDPAERARAVASGVAIVTTAATDIQTAIDGYDSGLLRDSADLVGRGYADGPGGQDSGLDAAVREYLQRLYESKGDWLGALGGGAGAAAVALGLKDTWKVLSKSGALLRFLNHSTKPITDYATFLRNIGAADDALAELMRGKANGGVLRFAVGSRAATVAGKAFLPLTVVTGAVDAVTGGGYDGARGWATRGFGAAGAVGAGALLASSAGLVALGPVGLGIAGAAVLGYGAWSLGNFVWDHREQLGEFTSNAVNWTGDRLSDATTWSGERLSDAKDWAGERLSDAGDAVEDLGKKAVSTLSFGLL